MRLSGHAARPRSAQQVATHATRQSLLEKIRDCDREAEAAAAREDQQQLLLQLEQGLHLRRKLHPESSDEVSAACRRLCQACNYAATARLQQEDLRGAQELLKKAEQVSDKSDKDQAITWNNMACYYRRTNKLRSAAKFLERALALEEQIGSPDAAQTQLNLCASLSQLKQHGEALRHAQSALIRLYESLMPQLLNGDLSAAGAVSESAKEQFTVLCIAYHNVAVENEFLQNLGAAACAYAEGYRWAAKFLGQAHQLASILRHAAESVKGKLPSGSGCVARVDEIMAGWPKAAAPQAGLSSVACSSGLGGASAIGILLTPRHEQRAGSPSLISERKEAPTARSKSKAASEEGEGYSEDASFDDRSSRSSRSSSDGGSSRR